MKTPVKFRILLVTVATIGGISSAHAYDAWYAGRGAVPVGYGAYGGYGGYGVYGGGYGGLGGVANGMGDLMRGEGQRNVDNSQAAINYQQANIEHQKARSAFIDTQNKLKDSRVKWKQEAQAQTAQENEAAKAQLARAQKFQDEHRPPPLSNSQFDPSTGRIDWPSALKAPAFEDLRKSLESSFQAASKSGLTADLSADMKSKVDQLKQAFHGQITQIPLSDYSQSRVFLDRLAVTVQSGS